MGSHGQCNYIVTIVIITIVLISKTRLAESTEQTLNVIVKKSRRSSTRSRKGAWKAERRDRETPEEEAFPGDVRQEWCDGERQ